MTPQGRAVTLRIYPWLIDPEKYGNHERRCEAHKTKRGPDGCLIRCSQRKQNGFKYCHFHVKRYLGKKKARSILGELGPPNSKARLVQRGLPIVYSKHLSRSLADKVSEARANDPYDLSEELALLKVMALDVVQLYDAVDQAVEAGNVKPEDRLQAKIAAGGMAREVLGEVFNSAKKMAEVESQRQDMVSALSLSSVLSKVVVAVHDVLGDDRTEEVKAISDAIRRIKLPSANAQGTELTPDQDVIDMDASVPLEPEEGDDNEED